MHYRSKPVMVDAFLWTGSLADLPDEWVDSGEFAADTAGGLTIQTLEGPARAHADLHYVVRGTIGEFYPVRRDVFEAKYEAVAQ